MSDFFDLNCMDNSNIDKELKTGIIIHILKSHLFTQHGIILLASKAINNNMVRLVLFLMNEYHIQNPVIHHYIALLGENNIVFEDIPYMIQIGVNFDIKDKNGKTVFDNYPELIRKIYMIPPWSIQRLLWLGKSNKDSPMYGIHPDVIHLIIKECRDWRYYR
jgi:hypothetical protein